MLFTKIQLQGMLLKTIKSLHFLGWKFINTRCKAQTRKVLYAELQYFVLKDNIFCFILNFVGDCWKYLIII